MRPVQIEEDPIASMGEAIYATKIRDEVEDEHLGKYIVINVKTGEYEIDADDVAAVRRAKARFGPDDLYTMRIGHTAAYRLGSTKR